MGEIMSGSRKMLPSVFRTSLAQAAGVGARAFAAVCLGLGLFICVLCVSGAIRSGKVQPLVSGGSLTQAISTGACAFTAVT